MTNLQLFASCVAIWGSTWLAITYQLGEVAPEASVFYRFLLASAMIFAYCRFRGLSLRFSRREHLWMALQGVLMFCVGYVFVYYAEQHVVSGIVAVGYSASPLLNLVLMRLIFGKAMSRRVALGGALGLLGIMLVFWPEFGTMRAGGDTRVGILFALASVFISSLGNMAAHRNQSAGLPIWQTMAWGMLYGAAGTFAMAMALGKSFTFLWTPAYVLSLVYLAVFGSILAFGGFLTLLGRIGPARTGYVGVMVPIVALAISASFEGFHWQALTWMGIAVSVAGNVIVLRGK